MKRKHSFTKPIIVGIIFFSLILSAIPTMGASLTIDEDDGIWSDTFLNDSNVNLSNCEVSDGNLHLTYGTTDEIYDFSDTTDNTAYSYTTPYFFLFLPPKLHTMLEKIFTDVGYAKIKSDDGDTFTTEGTLLRKIVVHHFRLMVTQDIDTITQLNLYWHGEVENNKEVTMYYWQPVGSIGGWEEAKSTTTNATDIVLQQNFTGDLFIDSDNYVDICIVVIPEIGEKCSLSTDYVKVTSQGEGYDLSGSAVSLAIEPNNLSYWEMLTFEDYERSDTSITYHILYNNETLVEDTILPGNENGFTSPTSLVPMIDSGVKKIRIRANLSTNDPEVSPRIYSWSILWQTEDNTWQDLFNSTLRVDETSNILIENGNASISYYTDWPIFGQNAANTRSSDGAGPKNDPLYWYSSSAYGVGGGYKNPVIKEGILYVASLDGDVIYAFNATVPSGHEGASNSIIDQVAIPEFTVKNTPAVTDDYIIVATGNTSASGEENKIYAFDRSGLTLAWEFAYGDVNPANPEICYSASPVVYDDKIFISAWNGDESLLDIFTEGNNKIIALDLSGSFLWEKELPARSFSTPAVYNDRVIVGCENKNNNSVFAFDSETGVQRWAANVGAIGRASPVVHNNKVFIVVKEQAIPLVSAYTNVVALSLSSGRIDWNASISDAILTTNEIAACTPAANNNLIFAASPDGTVYALDDDGSEVWSSSVYTRGLLSTQVMTSSPTYAENMVYVGTPDGNVYGLNAQNGTEVWVYEGDSSILSSPIVVDGLLYVSDEDGMLYSIGSYRQLEENITGNLVSIPIQLPQGHSWVKFYAKTNTSSGGSILFDILDEGKNAIVEDVKNGDSIADDVAGHSTLRLQAHFSIEDNSEKAILKDWSLTTKASNDTTKPAFDETSFQPTSGWITTYIPTCTIKVQDLGTGLAIGTAEYALEYKSNNQTTTRSHTETASCTGSSGTKIKQTITANISELDFSDNLTDLVRIRFSIADLVGNTAISNWHDFQTDTDKPTSEITNADDIPEKCTTSSVRVNASASDATSGIEKVGLYYRSVGSTSWGLFAYDSSLPYYWNFNIASSGEYELCTIAIDNAGNEEDEPDTGDVTFILDSKIPNLPDFEDVYWFNSSAEFSITFSDDFKLDTIEYKPNFETQWITIASDINQAIYGDAWEIAESYWNQMDEGESYYLYFRITDICGNQRLIDTQYQALEIRKDTVAPHIDIDLSDFTSDWQFDDKFNITTTVYDGNGSGIYRIMLYYRYSENNDTWTNWSLYSESGSENHTWEFTAEEGNGYYEFKVVAEDVAGNKNTLIESASVSLFPTIPFAIMATLMIILIIILIVFFVKWRRK